MDKLDDEFLLKELVNYIIQTILIYCDEQKISINQLAINSNMTQSTLQSIVSGVTRCPNILTITKICLGLNISVKEFFKDFLREELIQ